MQNFKWPHPLSEANQENDSLDRIFSSPPNSRAREEMSLILHQISTASINTSQPITQYENKTQTTSCGNLSVCLHSVLRWEIGDNVVQLDGTRTSDTQHTRTEVLEQLCLHCCCLSVPTHLSEAMAYTPVQNIITQTKSVIHTKWNTLLSHCSYTITYHCNTIICPLGINKLSILLWCKVRTLKRIYELCQFHKSYKIYHTWLLKIGQVICIICTFTSNSDLCIRF